jgi:hypothetical protein
MPPALVSRLLHRAQVCLNSAYITDFKWMGGLAELFIVPSHDARKDSGSWFCLAGCCASRSESTQSRVFYAPPMWGFAVSTSAVSSDERTSLAMRGRISAKGVDERAGHWALDSAGCEYF